MGGTQAGVGYLMVKSCDSGGWIVECNYWPGQERPEHERPAHEKHIAATPEVLVDRVLEFAARTDSRQPLAIQPEVSPDD